MILIAYLSLLSDKKTKTATVIDSGVSIISKSELGMKLNDS